MKKTVYCARHSPVFFLFSSYSNKAGSGNHPVSYSLFYLKDGDDVKEG
jgi:hypothetical protein